MENHEERLKKALDAVRVEEKTFHKEYSGRSALARVEEHLDSQWAEEVGFGLDGKTAETGSGTPGTIRWATEQYILEQLKKLRS